MSTIVVNTRREAHDVYIGRGSKWGNPYRITSQCSREQAIEKYRKYLYSRSDLMYSLGELEGKRLGCYCYPLACHGDVLVEEVNRRRANIEAVNKRLTNQRGIGGS